MQQQQTIAALRVAIGRKTAADETLRQAMLAAEKAGNSANTIAAELHGVISRPVVLRMLGEDSIRNRVDRALREVAARDGYLYCFPEGGVAVERFYGRGRRIMLHMVTASEEVPVSERYNCASSVMAALRAVGLGVCQGESTLNMQQKLGDYEPVEVYELT